MSILTNFAILLARPIDRLFDLLWSSHHPRDGVDADIIAAQRRSRR